MSASVHLVRGEDPSLRDLLVAEVVERALDGADRMLALDDLTIPSRRGSGGEEEPDAESVDLPIFRRVVTALDSPPMMTDKRVVVVRDIGNLTVDQVNVLVEWLADPIDSTELVLVTGGGRLNPKISKAVKALGGEDLVPQAEMRAKRGDPGPVAKQLQQSLALADLAISADAAARICAHLGEDAGRVPELVELLRATFGEGASLETDHVAPYLGEVGTAARYELTNAIDAGDAARALDVVARLTRSTSGKQAKVLHPIQVFASLQYHYRDLLQLDDPEISSKEQAAERLGMKSVWAASHRLDASRRLGSDNLKEAYRILSQADLDLRGASGVPEITVIEVLVARLCALSGSVERGTGRANR